MVSIKIGATKIRREVKRIFNKLLTLGVGYNFPDFPDGVKLLAESVQKSAMLGIRL